jgi:hypothetical protein
LPWLWNVDKVERLQVLKCSDQKQLGRIIGLKFLVRHERPIWALRCLLGADSWSYMAVGEGPRNAAFLNAPRLQLFSQLICCCRDVTFNYSFFKRMEHSLGFSPDIIDSFLVSTLFTNNLLLQRRYI